MSNNTSDPLPQTMQDELGQLLTAADIVECMVISETGEREPLTDETRVAIEQSASIFIASPVLWRAFSQFIEANNSGELAMKRASIH